MVKQFLSTVETSGRGFYEINHLINDYVLQTQYRQGICSIFLLHTSASLVICENADKDVKKDLENFFSKLIPDDPKLYLHHAEGGDDMPAHIRTILTKCDLTLPIVNGRLGLGSWQSIYIWEHRLDSFSRELRVTLIGA